MGLFAIKGSARKLMPGPVVTASIEATSPRQETRGEPQADRAGTVAANDEPLAALLTPPPVDPTRAGLVQWEEGGHFLHYCQCGAWGVFGYAVDLKAGRLGQWYCPAHKPEVSP